MGSGLTVPETGAPDEGGHRPSRRSGPLGEQGVHLRRQLRDCRRVIQHRHGQVDPEFRLDLAEDVCRDQGVAAEIEVAVIHSDAVDAERFAPDLREDALGRRARLDIGSGQQRQLLAPDNQRLLGSQRLHVRPPKLAWPRCLNSLSSGRESQTSIDLEPSAGCPPPAARLRHPRTPPGGAVSDLAGMTVGPQSAAAGFDAGTCVVDTVNRDSSVTPTTTRKTARGSPRSMSQPKHRGPTTPPRLNPVVTNPNTFPKDPAGVTARTIMSREGWMTPPSRPAIAISAMSSADPSGTVPITRITVALSAKPTPATLVWWCVRSAMMPPSRTPSALRNK